MSYLPLRTFTTIILLIAGLTGHAQVTTDTSAVAETVERAGEKFLRSPNIRSLSVGVLIGGKTVRRHFGELNTGQGNTPNDQTVYEIASVTKTMVGYLVASTVEAGKLSLDDDVRSFLTEPYPNLVVDGEPIRIRHLLTHTSGLPGFLPLAWNGVFETFTPDVPYRFHELEQQYGKEEFWQDLATVQLTEPPGTTYAYSSAGTELLAYILEQVNEMSLTKQLEMVLTGPRGMAHTKLRLAETSEVVTGYWMDNEDPSPANFNSLWGGGVGVTTTLPDLLRFAALQLRADDPIVKRSHEVVYTNGGSRHIAYCWNVWRDKYGTSYNHHGGTSGTQNWLYIFPDHDLAISLITNHSGPKTAGKMNQTVHRIVRKLVDTRR
ncbi:MAG: serine hydrolase domain-containing protein [Lewinella sp.]